MTQPSFAVLFLVIAIVGVLTVYARPYALLLFAIVAIILPPGDWSLVGLRIDTEDVVNGGILLCFLSGAGGATTGRGETRRLPYLALWIVLGTWMSIAYLVAPINQPHLTDPVRILYQLYRYCWKAILPYLVAAALLGNDDRRQLAGFLAIIAAGDLIALHATLQGYTHRNPLAQFGTGNGLGAALVIPAVMAFAALFCANTRARFAAAVMSNVLIWRGLLFSSSRGAAVSVVAGVGLFGLVMLADRIGRRGVFRVAQLGLAGLVVLFVLVPDLLQRPNVAHVLTALRGTEDETFRWRREERWGYFFAKVVANPWFGTGTSVDWTLGPSANTPHNGYIALAVINGIPVAALIVVLALIAIRYAWRVGRRAPERSVRFYALASGASIIGVMIHNIVDATFLSPFVMRLFWTLAACTIMKGRSLRAPVTQSSPRMRSVISRRRALPLRPRPLRTHSRSQLR